MPRLNWPFFANFNFSLLMSLAFNISSHAVQVTNNKQNLSQKKKQQQPSTMNHYRTRRQPEKAAWTYFDRCNLSVGSDDKSLISEFKYNLRNHKYCKKHLPSHNTTQLSRHSLAIRLPVSPTVTFTNNNQLQRSEGFFHKGAECQHSGIN